MFFDGCGRTRLECGHIVFYYKAKQKGLQGFPWREAGKKCTGQTAHYNNNSSKGLNQIHINALYSVLDKQFLDALAQLVRKHNEYSSLCWFVLFYKFKFDFPFSLIFWIAIMNVSFRRSDRIGIDCIGRNYSMVENKMYCEKVKIVPDFTRNDTVSPLLFGNNL